MIIEKKRLEKILLELLIFLQSHNNELIDEFFRSSALSDEEINDIKSSINHELLDPNYIRSLVTEEMYDIPLEDLELGLRSYNSLKRAGVSTLRDIKSVDDFSSIRNLGRKCLLELVIKLEELRKSKNITDFGIATVLDKSGTVRTSQRRNVIRFEDFINNDGVFDPSGITPDMLERFERIIDSLNDREKYVLRKRYAIGTQKATLNELATELGYSLERIRQIELMAKKKFKSNQLRQDFS